MVRRSPVWTLEVEVYCRAPSPSSVWAGPAIQAMEPLVEVMLVTELESGKQFTGSGPLGKARLAVQGEVDVTVAVGVCEAVGTGVFVGE